MVIDLAVEDDRGAIGSHRLNATLGEIEDREPAMTKGHAHVVAVFPTRDVAHEHVGEAPVRAPREQIAGPIRAAMDLAVVHAVQHDRIDGRTVECENADDPAHGARPSGRGRPRRHERPGGRLSGCAAHGIAIDGDHLLSQQSLVQVADGGAAGDATTAGQHARERRRDGVRPVVGAQLAPRDAVKALGDVPHGNGDDGQIAGERFFDHVG